MIYFQEPNAKDEISYVIQEVPVVPKESSFFSSKIDRFKTVKFDSQAPGPGSYSIPTKDIQRTSKYKVKMEINNDLRLQHLWLLQDKRFGNHQTSKTKHIGPGTYSPDKTPPKQSQNFSFAKNHRFKQSKQTTMPKLGPGVYETESSRINSKSKSIVSSFKSKTLRFVNNPDKSLELYKRPDSKLKLVNPQTQIGSRQRSNEHMQKKFQLLAFLKDSAVKEKNKNQISYIFKSKKPRFQSINSANIGPGYYEKDPKQSQKSIESRHHLNIKKGESQLKKQKGTMHFQDSSIIPGPNMYNVNHYSIEKQINTHKRGGYINQETRFNFHQNSKSKSIQYPGPGAYSQQKYMFVDKQAYLKQNFDFKNKHRSASSNSVPFLSSSDRLSIRDNTNASPFVYDSNIYDINRKVQKNTLHLAKLKMMDIELSAFSTKQKRM